MIFSSWGFFSWFVFSRNFEFVELVFNGNCWEFPWFGIRNLWDWFEVFFPCFQQEFLIEFVGFFLFIFKIIFFYLWDWFLPGIFNGIPGIFPC